MTPRARAATLGADPTTAPVPMSPHVGLAFAQRIRAGLVRLPRRARLALARAAFAAMLVALAAAAPAAEDAWPVAGRQGIVQLVIVPADQARDREAYRSQAERLCPDPDAACFLNFYTNTSGAPLAVPLPDAIAAEATATYRRSPKRAAETFSWNCRVMPNAAGCF